MFIDLVTPLNELFAGLKRNLDRQQNTISRTIAQCIRLHISNKYPGSKHWNPNKVTYERNVVHVDIPGATRAYHDIDIKPKHAKHLAIPLHRSAYGLSPKTLDLKLVFRRNKMFLVDKATLAFMYVLKNHVHQNQDPSLLPTDNTLANAAGRQALQNALTNLDKRFK